MVNENGTVENPVDLGQHSTRKLHYLNRVTEEIRSIEKELEEAQNDFTQNALQTTAKINSMRLGLGFCIKNVNCRIPGPIECMVVPDGQDDADERVQYLQKELKNRISNSSLFVKRSLMKFNNLLSQHSLLFLPFCELKVYYNQLLDYKKRSLELEISEIKPRLSYAQALQCIKELSVEIDQTKQEILDLSQERNTFDCKTLDYSDLVSNDYKAPPSF